LTSTQLQNALQDAFGFVSPRLATLPTDLTGTDALDAPSTRTLLSAAEEMGQMYVAHGGPAVTTCAAAPIRAACMSEQIARLGMRLFRRPLSAAESASFAKIYSNAAAARHEDGVETAIAALVLSPHFLYRVDATPVMPRPYATAARLAFGLWGSLPDQALLDAAGSKALDTPDGLANEARRLWADAKTKRQIRSFGQAYVPYADIGQTARFDAAGKVFSPTTLGYFEAETDAYVDAMFAEKADFATFLAGNTSHLNKTLAAFYGATGPKSDTAFVKTPLPSTRAGLLLQASLLSSLSHEKEASPILRGGFIRRRLLCDALPDPPAEVGDPEPPMPGVSQRRRLEKHRGAPDCAACHVFIDAIGFGLEKYDQLGARTDVVSGTPVTGAGELTSMAGEGTFKFTDGPELARYLAASEKVQRCFVRTIFVAMSGQPMDDVTEARIEPVFQAFKREGLKISSLPALIAASGTFHASGGRP